MPQIFNIFKKNCFWSSDVLITTWNSIFRFWSSINSTKYLWISIVLTETRILLEFGIIVSLPLILVSVLFLLSNRWTIKINKKTFYSNEYNPHLKEVSLVTNLFTDFLINKFNDFLQTDATRITSNDGEEELRVL